MAGNKQTVPKPILAISLVAIMLLSGCLGVFDGDDSNHDFVEIDLGDAMKRSIGSPYLESFSDCEELESALKISIEEEAKTSILQAVEDVYYWGGGMWLEGDAEMAMDDGASSTSAPSTRQEGVDYSGTNNQEQGVDEADFVKTDG